MMKKHLRQGIVAVAGLGLFIAACNKDNDSGPAITPNEMKLTAHSWSITAATLSSGTVTDSSFYTDCMQDDSLDFKTNKSFSFSDGATACDSALLPYGSGVWAFNTAEDTLLIKYSDTTKKWQVQSLTDSTLQLSYADSLNHKAVTKTLKLAAKQ
jgi:hypothetical protein